MTIQQLEAFSNTKPELRYITEEIIKYLGVNPGGSSSPGSSYLVYTATVGQSTIQHSSGPLVVGEFYKITEYHAGDDFINVGAASNAVNVLFQASGTTPTNWTHNSKLISAGDLVVTILGDNTIGDIVWTREDVGYYFQTLANAFPETKTICPPFDPNAYSYLPISGDTSTFDFAWTNGYLSGSGASVCDLVLCRADYSPIDICMIGANFKLFVEIRVYP